MTLKDSPGNPGTKRWYLGSYTGDIHEMCYGWIVTGYSYMGGPENKPYSHSFWGLCWGDFTLGLGIVVADEPWRDSDD